MDCSTMTTQTIPHEKMSMKDHQQRLNDEASRNNKKKTKTTFPRRNTSIVSVFIQQMFVSLFIFLAFLLEGVPTAYVRRRKVATLSEATLRDDLLCNLGDEHECVCNRSRGNLDHSAHVGCIKFLEVKRLEVVSIVLRDINLNIVLHTNETYEQYLRRRIANILSQYCDNMPTECSGTLADLRSQQQNKKSPSIDINDKTTEVLYDDTVFSRENVVILRVTYPPGRSRTELSFVVTKRVHTIGLSPASIFDPTTVKYILSAQLAPLSRVLGGIRIEQFGIDVLEKPVEPVNNKKLLIMIGVIGTAIAFCCTIAAVRQFCLSYQSRREMQQQNQGSKKAEKRSTRNYGTCTDKFFSHLDLSNGHAKSKSVCSRDSNSSKKTKKGKKMSKCSSEAPAMAATGVSEVSPRSFQNIFTCDHSQLPKEEGEDEEFELEIRRIKHKLSVRSPRSPFSSDDDALAGGGGGFHGFHFPDRPVGNEKRPSITVVLDEGFGSPLRIAEKEQPSRSGEKLLLISQDHPFERPLSRRGSITDEGPQEDGEEEAFNDTREETPVPLGDDQNVVVVERPLIDVVLRKGKEKSGRIILSESESEEEENDEEEALYRPLREENAQKIQNCDIKERIGSSSESEEMDKKERDMLERHQYERLLESPMPQSDPTQQQQQQQNNKTPKIVLSD